MEGALEAGAAEQGGVGKGSKSDPTGPTEGAPCLWTLHSKLGWVRRTGLRGREPRWSEVLCGCSGWGGCGRGKAVASAKLSEAAEGFSAGVSPSQSPSSRAGVEGGNVTRSTAQVLGPSALLVTALGLAPLSQLPSL